MADYRMKDASFKFMKRIGSELVSESGNEEDRYHLGKMILKAFRENPDAVNQIDAATGQTETNSSVLNRSTKLAEALRNYGLDPGDVVAMMAPNHLDLCLPFFACLYTGGIIMAVDRTLALRELVSTFETGRPKLVFCQSERATEVQLALNRLELDSLVVTFDSGDYMTTSLEQFMQQYGGDGIVEDFKATDLKSDSISFIIATSGTTGLPKAAVCTHKNFAISGPYLWMRHSRFPKPVSMALLFSPLQWLTALFSYLFGAIFTYTRLQSSAAMTQQHCYDIINKYRPDYTISSPTMMNTLLKMPDRLQCDFTCFDLIKLGGSAVPQELIEYLTSISGAVVNNVFGMSELSGMGFNHDGDTAPPGSCGRPIGCLQYRIMDVDTGDEILDTHTPGELWLAGPVIFKGYYNNPEATKESFSNGRWFRTGDMFYRDEAHNYYYVDRIKLMLKYKSYQISPVEVENVIRTHPDVQDVVVTGKPDPDCGDLLVAFVVRNTGSGLTAQEVKDVVRDNLSESKHLHGGVVFLDAIPLTASTKIHRRKIKEMAATMQAE